MKLNITSKDKRYFGLLLCRMQHRQDIQCIYIDCNNINIDLFLIDNIVMKVFIWAACRIHSCFHLHSAEHSPIKHEWLTRCGQSFADLGIWRTPTLHPPHKQVSPGITVLLSVVAVEYPCDSFLAYFQNKVLRVIILTALGADRVRWTQLLQQQFSPWCLLSSQLSCWHHGVSV